MYLLHYNLAKHPFSISPDPEFLWLSQTHKKAVAVLKYGFLEDKGFLALTGDVGTGKTLLVRNLVRSIPASSIIVDVPDPDMKPMEFFRYLAEETGMQKNFKGKGEFQIQLKQFLHEAFGSNKKVLLIIDEAQRLNHKLLEQIRLLSNLQAEKRKLINIFLVGQNEFDHLLKDERSKATRQRITVRYQLKPFADDETFGYINHRLKIAGSLRPIFSPEAIRKIHQYSKGYPRSINVLCDHALMLGYGAGLQVIDADAVEESRMKLAFESRAARIKTNEPKPSQTIIESTQQPQTPKPSEGRRAEIAPIFPRSLLKPAGLLAILFLIVLAGHHLGGGDAGQPDHRILRPAAIPHPPAKVVTEFGHRWESYRSTAEDPAIPPPTQPESRGRDATPHASTQVMRNPSPALLDGTAKPIPNRNTDAAGSAARVGVAADEAGGLTSGESLINANSLIIYFNTGSVSPSEDSLAALDRMVEQIRTYPQTTVLIEGYTDSSGDANYNLQLSKFRAMTIKSYFSGKGISPSKIRADGMGPKNPIASNATLAGRKKNRRVEIRINVGN